MPKRHTGKTVSRYSNSIAAVTTCAKSHTTQCPTGRSRVPVKMVFRSFGPVLLATPKGQLRSDRWDNGRRQSGLGRSVLVHAPSALHTHVVCLDCGKAPYDVEQMRIIKEKSKAA